MTAKASAHPQRLLIGLIVFITLGCYVYVTSVFQPLIRSITDLSSRVRTASIQLQQVQQLVAQEGTLRQEYARLTSNVTKLRTGLPMDSELPSIIQLLSDLADQSGVKIVSIFPQRALDVSETTQKSGKTGTGAVQPQLYKEIPIEIEALTGFHQLGMFLSRVETAPQPMRVKALHINANQKEIRRQSVNAVLIAYFALTNTVGVSKAGGS